MAASFAVQLAVLFAAPVAAAEVRLIAADTAFGCGAERHVAPASKPATDGLLCEIVHELARRAGHARPIEIYPLQRALMLAETGAGVLAVVGRTPERERRHVWQVQLLEEEIVAVTRREAEFDIDTPAALRVLKVGIVRQGLAASLATEQGLPDVSPVSRDETNARKLAVGRIDAWVGPWNAILTAQRAAGLPVDGLRRGVVLRRVPVYLASSPNFDAAVARVWSKAFETMVVDGTYDRLLLQYRFERPAPAGKHP
ncbi:substrate-binding periplasmic protein [Duganella sp. BuS-21]|uniref:substrate-binding periplasmic protein n=1 Tax=Duganella sp. BuS-21 TaxID=2943848 RepID=UPI0035A64927